MHLALHVTRKVQVDIGRFIAVEAKECLKGDVLTVGIHRRTAMRAIFIGKVKARAIASVRNKFVITAGGATVVRRQGIHLGNTRHDRNEGGADRSARANEISVLLAERNQLLRNHVKDGKAVLDDRIQLFIQTHRNDFGDFPLVTVPIHGAIPTALL